MDIEKVFEFTTGKNGWNTFEIGVKDGNIVVRDDVGMIEFEEEAVDRLVKGIDQARRRIRENERRPTQERGEQASTVEEPAADETDNDADADDEDSDDDGPMSTGLGPSMGPSP